MKVSAMSDEALSRRIAEKLEPFESLPRPLSQSVLSATNCQYRGVLGWVSRGGSWKAGRVEWEPLDMIHEPAMTVMLMEKLIDAFTDCRKGFDLIADEFAGHPPFSSQLGRAVAQAYAISNGVEDGKD